jgi:hypothetical protein
MRAATHVAFFHGFLVAFFLVMDAHGHFVTRHNHPGGTMMPVIMGLIPPLGQGQGEHVKVKASTSSEVLRKELHVSRASRNAAAIN